MRLRLGLLHVDLAYRLFHVSAKHVSTIVLTWIQFLYKRLSDLKRPMLKSTYQSALKSTRIFVALLTAQKFMCNNQATLLHKEMLTHLTKGILHLSF